MSAGVSQDLRNDLRALMAGIFSISLSDMPSEATPDNTRGWDSLAHLQLIEALERRYDLSISHAEAVTLLSDADISVFIAKKASKSAMSGANLAGDGG